MYISLTPKSVSNLLSEFETPLNTEFKKILNTNVLLWLCHANALKANNMHE